MKKRLSKRTNFITWARKRRFWLIITWVVICIVINFLIFGPNIFNRHPRVVFKEKNVENIMNVKLVKNRPYLYCHPNQKFVELSNPHASFVVDMYKYYPGDEIVILMMSYNYVDSYNYKYHRPPYQMKIYISTRPENSEEFESQCVLNDCDAFEDECISNVLVCKFPEPFKNLKSRFYLRFENDKDVGKKYILQDCVDLPSYKYSVSVMVANSVKFLKEWVRYHHFLGFEHIYIYCIKDDDSTCDYGDKEFGDFVTTFRVSHLPFTQGSQFFTFADASYRYRRNSWISLNDVDEFPVFLPNLQSFTEKYEDSKYSTLQMRTVAFDSKGFDGEVFKSDDDFLMMKTFRHFSRIVGVVEKKRWMFEEMKSKVIIKPSRAYFGGVHMYCSRPGYFAKSVDLEEGYVNHYYGKYGNRKLSYPYKGSIDEIKSKGFEYFEVLSDEGMNVMRGINERYLQIFDESCRDEKLKYLNFCGKKEEDLRDDKLKYWKVQKSKLQTTKIYDKEKWTESSFRGYTCPSKYCCEDVDSKGKYVSFFENWKSNKK